MFVARSGLTRLFWRSRGSVLPSVALAPGYLLFAPAAL
jgi:hypothetical protein